MYNSICYTEKILKKPLKTFARFASGIYAKTNPMGEVLYVQGRHFNSLGQFDKGVLPDLDLDGKISRHLLKQGDILFAIKGHHNFAVQYQKAMGKAVASSIFMIIRIQQQNLILPEYLIWYLNHPQSQNIFRNQSRGSDLPSLNLKTLENFSVEIPSLEKQKSILRLQALSRQEMALRKKIEALRKHHIEQLLFQSIHLNQA